MIIIGFFFDKEYVIWERLSKSFIGFNLNFNYYMVFLIFKSYGLEGFMWFLIMYIFVGEWYVV